MPVRVADRCRMDSQQTHTLLRTARMRAVLKPSSLRPANRLRDDNLPVVPESFPDIVVCLPRAIALLDVAVCLPRAIALLDLVVCLPRAIALREAT